MISECIDVKFKDCKTHSRLQGSGRSPIKPICLDVRVTGFCSDELIDSSNFHFLARAVNSLSNCPTCTDMLIVLFLFRPLDDDIALTLNFISRGQR